MAGCGRQTSANWSRKRSVRRKRSSNPSLRGGFRCRFFHPNVRCLRRSHAAGAVTGHTLPSPRPQIPSWWVVAVASVKSAPARLARAATSAGNRQSARNPFRMVSWQTTNGRHGHLRYHEASRVVHPDFRHRAGCPPDMGGIVARRDRLLHRTNSHVSTETRLPCFWPSSSRHIHDASLAHQRVAR